MNVNHCFLSMIGFINDKKNAAEITDEPNNIHMIIIWYRTAMNGDTPDKICPVIMPGKDTKPTANNALVMGINEALKATRRAVK